VKKILVAAGLLALVIPACTKVEQYDIPKGPPPVTSAPEQFQTSNNSPLTASVAPQARGRRTDRLLSDKVRLAMINDPALAQIALDRIRVESLQGKVTVAGIVTSDAQEKAVLDRVKSVEGVTGVDDQVEILPSSGAPPPPKPPPPPPKK
jgi:hypothetical protein